MVPRRSDASPAAPFPHTFHRVRLTLNNAATDRIMGGESMSLYRLMMSAAVLAFSATLATPSFAQKKYDTGATDTEIKIGQTIPLSGPASAYGSIGKVQAAYIRMINEAGGGNGREHKT